MKKNGLKRAGCVLLAAQMSISVLPMNSWAAYVDMKARSEASVPTVSFGRLAGRDTALFDKERMPMFSKRAVALAVNTGNTESDVSPVDDETTNTAGAAVTGGETGEEPVDPPEKPSEEPEESPSAEPDEEPEESPSAEPDEEPEESPPTEPGEEPEESPPAEPGEEPEESPPTEPGEEPEESPPAEPGEEPQTPALQQGDGVMPVSGSPETEDVFLNIYAYNYWAESSDGTYYTHKEPFTYNVPAVGAVTSWMEAERRYPPYAREKNENQGLLGKDTITKIAYDYGVLEDEHGNGVYTFNWYKDYTDSSEWYGDDDGNNKPDIEDLKDLKLWRIPDMEQDGWVFAQKDPETDYYDDAKNNGVCDLNDQVTWHQRYDPELPADAYDPDFDTVRDHSTHVDGSFDPDWTYYTDVVAKWVPSTNATLTDLSIYTWKEDETESGSKQKENCTTVESGTVKDTVELKVSAQTDRLTLDFTTYEPGTMIMIKSSSLEKPILYRYDRSDYVVTVTEIRKDENSNDFVIPYTDDEMQAAYSKLNVDNTSPLKRTQTGIRKSIKSSLEASVDPPTNSAENPARGVWSLPLSSAIPLVPATATNPETKIEIVVVAPDGTIEVDGEGNVTKTTGTTKTYTIKVTRFADPEMTLNRGNSPYVLLEQAKKKNETEYNGFKATFDAERKLAPRLYGFNDLGWRYYTGVYSKAAWGDGPDYDEDLSVIVAYQNSVFKDTGFQLKDSVGKTVASNKVHRTIKLRTVPVLSTSVISDTSGTPVYYTAGGMTATETKELVVGDGTDEIDLRGENIVPGIYTIEYSYADPVSGLTYNSQNTGVFNEATKADSFSRTLIILPQPGDLDMDGLVTVADALELERLLADPTSFVSVDRDGQPGDRAQQLFKYRVCDVDGDGKVTNSDLVALKGKYAAQIDPVWQSTDYFYTSTGDYADVSRHKLATGTATAGKAALSVDYLGSNIVGAPTGVVNQNKIVLNEMFWVGVKLDDVANLPTNGKDVDAFTFTFAYDPEYIEPGVMEGCGDWNATFTAANPGWSGYKLDDGSGARAVKTNKGNYSICRADLAQPTLEKDERKLATLTVVLTHKSGESYRQLSDGYVLYLPFKFISHPVGKENVSVPMLEPLMGARQFGITFSDGTRSAWSEESSVFGGVTVNLRDYIVYTGCLVDSDSNVGVPVGEDKSEFEELLDADSERPRYGESFESQLIDYVRLSILAGTLPPGMAFDSADGRFYTTDDSVGVTQAGTYLVTLGVSGDPNSTIRLRIVVEQATLTLTVDGNGYKYYGEPNPDGSKIKYYFDVSDLKKQDKAVYDSLTGVSAGNGRGLGDRLQDVLNGDTGYKRPTITMVDDAGKELQKDTPANASGKYYTVKLTGGATTNYKFVYKDKTGARAEAATNNFQVSPRHLIVSAINGPVAEISNNTITADRARGGLTANYATSGAKTFTATVPSSHSGEAVLDKDKQALQLQFTGTFLGDSGKGDTGDEFNLTSDSETRKVKITNVKLIGTASANYVLDGACSVENSMSTGTVKRKDVTKVVLYDWSKMKRDYAFGEKFSLLNLGAISLEWDGGSKTDPFYYTPGSDNHGVTLCWVDKKGDAPTSVTAADGEELGVKKHNNKWLCVYVDNGDGKTPACEYVGPFTVTPAELTLTVKSETRYYGEPELTTHITYDRAGLVGSDYNNIWNRGELSELVNDLPGFVAPTVSHRVTAAADGQKVTKTTDVGNYYVVISGASADNYVFKYKQYTQGSGTAAVSNDFGCSPLTVVKRPIQVTKIDTTGNGNTAIGSIYDDSDPFLTVRGTMPKATGQTFEVTTALPTGTSYHVNSNGLFSQESFVGTLTGSPIVDGDTVTFGYRVNYVTDNASGLPSYFDLSTTGWDANGKKSYPVKVDDLSLSTTAGDASKNYVLAYSTYDKAYHGYPDDVDAQGDVVIRKITNLEVISAPSYMNYTHGEKISFAGLQVRITYNVGNSKTIPYASKSDFERYGLTLEWTDKNGAVVNGGAAEPATESTAVTVVDHNGRNFVIRGQRHSSHTAVTAVVSTPVQVKKKKITMAPSDKSRFYGEENLLNTTYYYYEGQVPFDQLTEEDQALLTAKYPSEADRNEALKFKCSQLSDPAKNEALEYLAAQSGEGVYVGPSFHTNALKSSPVGSYSLQLVGGTMTNYEFDFTPGTIEVRKRPIKIGSIDKEVLATITQESKLWTVNGATVVYKGENPGEHEVGFMMGQIGINDYMTGNAIVTGDSVVLSMTVQFGFDEHGNAYNPNDISWTKLNANENYRMVYVKISNLQLTNGGENYELQEDPALQNTVYRKGRVDGRTIRSVELVDPNAPKLDYKYGERIDLSGTMVKIVYDEDASVEQEMPGRNDKLSIHYVMDYNVVNDPTKWEALFKGELAGSREALGTDIPTIAKDAQGYSFANKYLVISVRQIKKGTNGVYEYLQPIVVGQTASGVKMISIEPQKLEYRLTANDKKYDGTTVGSGTVWMDVNQILFDDLAYIDNGTDYTQATLDDIKVGAEYRFDSSATGIRFQFADKNVAYAETPTHDSYGDYTDIPLSVSGINLKGKDAANYVIVDHVDSSDPAAPRAVIERATTRPAPDLAALTTMSTDVHTNTVTVSVAGDATTFGDSQDDYNDELHYEYQLEYLVNETDLDRGFVYVEGGDSRFFGGEKFEYISEVFEPAADETDELTPGMGQSAVAGDSGFGQRETLPRDTYFRAKVRLARTHNYEPSDYTPSLSDAEIISAVAQARAQEESDENVPTAEKKEDTQPPRLIADDQRLGKTYQYAFEIIAVQSMRGTDQEQHVKGQLDSVWFADRATYPKEEHFNALTTDPGEPRYHDYAWDAEQTQTVRFPLDMREELKASLTQADGSKAETVVNADGTARLYASLNEKEGGSFFAIITIQEGNITAQVGDAPIQLHAKVEPYGVADVTWRSSDTSVATVSEDGLLSFVGAGTTTIRAELWGFMGTIRVTVLPKEEYPVVDLLPLDRLFNEEYLDSFMDLNEELHFDPKRPITRGELAIVLEKFIVPSYKLPEKVGNLPFKDITPDMECAGAVELLNRLGILKGMTEDEFMPDGIVTRAQMATILVRLGQLPAAPSGYHQFADCTPDKHWAWAEIAALEYSGITKGIGNDLYMPERPVTREETATFLVRMLRYKLDLKQPGIKFPADLEGDYWAWRSILQAINGIQANYIGTGSQWDGWARYCELKRK